MPEEFPPVSGRRTARHSDQLPCGASMDDLLAQVTERQPPRDPAHQRGCPHCRAALAELREIWAPVADLAAEEVRAPRVLLQSVMAAVRELSHNAWYAVIPGPTGQTRVAARVVGAVARLAAESVPHVSLALGGGRTATPPDATPDPARIAGAEAEVATTVGVAGAHVVVDVQIAVDYGAAIPEIARQVRQEITRHVARHTGLTTTEVNVVVVDVVDDGRQPSG